MLLAGLGADVADAAAEIVLRLESALAAPLQLAAASGPVQVVASIGIALHPRDGSTAERILDHADRAMYRVKERRRRGRAA